MKRISAISLAAAFVAYQTPGHARPHFCLDYESVIEDACDTNLPGTELFIYWCPRVNFTTIGDVKASPATFAELTQVDTAHTFTGTKGFFKLQVAVDENSVKHSAEGKLGGPRKNTARIFIKGNRTQIVGLLHQLKDDDCIFLIPLKDGNIAQLGSKHSKAIVSSVAFDSKTDMSTDPRGWEVNIECADKQFLYYKNSLAITLDTTP